MGRYKDPQYITKYCRRWRAKNPDKCNRALGLLNDDVVIVSNLVDYLKRHNGQN